MKCFDTTQREGLRLKFFRSGIKGKVLRILRNMYQQVKSCFNPPFSYAIFPQYAIRLRQGEAMSLILFSLFCLRSSNSL